MITAISVCLNTVNTVYFICNYLHLEMNVETFTGLPNSLSRGATVQLLRSVWCSHGDRKV